MLLVFAERVQKLGRSKNPIAFSILLLKHRRVIVEQEGRAPLAEKQRRKCLVWVHLQQLYIKWDQRWAPAAPNESILHLVTVYQKVLGHLKIGQIFLIAPSKERFRDWYKDHKKGGQIMTGLIQTVSPFCRKYCKRTWTRA